MAHDRDRDEAAASALVAAGERAWAAIQARHPEVPEAVIVLGSGVERGRLVKLGHWWAAQWRVDGQARGEVLLAGEALHLKPEEVFEILLHEAAHGLCAARGVPDTSRQGRYHNRRFFAAATEVGLRPRRLDPYGWARTELTEDAASVYAEVIGDLGAAMRLARGLPAPRGAGVEGGIGDKGGRGRGNGRGSPSQPAACACTPPRRMRMAPSVLARGPVTCGVCGTNFATAGVERAAPGRTMGPTGAVAAAPVDVSFLARRQKTLEAERAAEILIDGLAHLERIGVAIAAVSQDDPDGDEMVAVFRQAKQEIATWLSDLVAERHGLTTAELNERAGLDLTSVELPDQPEPNRVREPGLPGRGEPHPDLPEGPR